jgi:hypothetical protein
VRTWGARVHNLDGQSDPMPTCAGEESQMSLLVMNRTVASIFRATCFFCAGFATAALAQSDAPAGSDQGCVKTRCSTPSCFRQYAGGYYMRCPNGNHPVPRGQEYPQQPQKPVDIVKEAPPGVALQDVAGDWEVRMGTSGKALAALHLRLSPSGSLTGTLETLLTPRQQVKLEEVRISGKTITYKTLNGNAKQGTFSGDGQTINGEQGDPTWQRVRTLAQALAEDAKEKPPAP